MVERVEYLQDTLEAIFFEYESARFDDALNEIMQTSKDTDHFMVSQDISRAVLVVNAHLPVTGNVQFKNEIAFWR